MHPSIFKELDGASYGPGSSCYSCTVGNQANLSPSAQTSFGFYRQKLTDWALAMGIENCFEGYGVCLKVSAQDSLLGNRG
jgi:hypothetical protein